MPRTISDLTGRFIMLNKSIESSKLAKLAEHDDASDPALAADRARLRTVKPHEPKPGDLDYLSPEQIEWIKSGR